MSMSEEDGEKQEVKEEEEEKESDKDDGLATQSLVCCLDRLHFVPIWGEGGEGLRSWIG